MAGILAPAVVSVALDVALSAVLANDAALGVRRTVNELEKHVAKHCQ